MRDILVASETARFGMTEVKVGKLGGASHLVFLVGRRKARGVFLTAGLITAQELYQLGSVRAVVSPGDLLSTGHELPAVFAKMSPIGVHLAKEAFNRVEYVSFKECYRIEQEYTARLAAFEDGREAARAWIELRDPEW